MAQKDTNPYKYSDSNKRYMTYDWYMKRRFGGKVAKVTLDIGCTCPNIDGTRGHGGCIYCKRGSRSAVGEDLAEQYRNGVAVASRKWKPVGFIPYLQSNTNTYGDVDRLARAYSDAADLEGAVMLDIATRADCLSDEIISELVSLARRIPLTVELGLQTTCDSTAELINRCHTYDEFCRGYTRLKAAADMVNGEFPGDSEWDLPMKRLLICVHIINGLPGETADHMLTTARDVARLRPDMIKIHLMHVLDGTPLGDMCLRGEYTPMEREDYVNITCDQLELLPPETIIARVTGDGVASELLAPMWSTRKTEVANEIDKELYRRNACQGAKWFE
ncbi:MAG: TIGR01212 family radical SAM protein [Ruminococcaceae bacterium]|nr:TIGR01212 family radical SAM protein [Oscillospiraceae bacterium]